MILWTLPVTQKERPHCLRAQTERPNDGFVHENHNYHTTSSVSAAGGHWPPQICASTTICDGSGCRRMGVTADVGCDPCPAQQRVYGAAQRDFTGYRAIAQNQGAVCHYSLPAGGLGLQRGWSGHCGRLRPGRYPKRTGGDGGSRVSVPLQISWGRRKVHRYRIYHPGSGGAIVGKPDYG